MLIYIAFRISHWSRVRIYTWVQHTNIASDDGLAHVRWQAITWINAYFLFTIQKLAFEKMHLKCRLRNGGHFVSASIWYIHTSTYDLYSTNRSPFLLTGIHFNRLHAIFCHRKHLNESTMYAIPPHWHHTGSCILPQVNQELNLFYISNIVGADDQAKWGVRASTTIKWLRWTGIIRSPRVYGW